MADDDRSAASALAEFVPRMARVIAVALQSDPSVALTIRQYRTLERLLAGPLRTSELASSSNVSQPTATTVINSLEVRDLVVRRPDPDDGRASLLEITAMGRTTFESAHHRVLDRLAVITHDLDDKSTAALWEMVPLLLAGMDRARDIPHDVERR
jgi:DNA-binding MarR family transcriptional regulator